MFESREEVFALAEEIPDGPTCRAWKAVARERGGRPGNLGFPVFRTPLGRIGTFICYDGWFPESYRLCATLRIAPIRG